jgi:transposase
MQYTHILGIDVSKATIDLALSQNKAKATITHKKFNNNIKGFKSLLVWLKQLEIGISQVLVCLENTGIYGRRLVTFLQSEQAFVWVVNPVEIKRSIGLVRGKDDQADAERICLYAFRHQDKAQAYIQPEESLEKVAALLSARESLVKAKKMLLAPVEEKESVGLSEEAALMREVCQENIACLNKGIKNIEKKLEEVINQEKKLEANYKLVCSVKGVGKITALYLLVYTGNFNKFSSAKKLASYCGIVPFPYSSGTSIRGKTQVHPMANKRLKTALHMCALSSIKQEGQMRTYYTKKVAEGKNKMSVINAIRNKLVQRVFACVRDQQAYNYNQAA